MALSRLTSFVIGGLLGVIAGAGGMLIAFPYLFPPPVASDAPPAAARGARAMFVFDRAAPGRDAVHWANGTGAIVDAGDGRTLRLEADFEAGPGPNYWIYLNTRAVGEEKDFLADGGRVRLAKLKAFKGAQNYALPPDLDPGKFHTVTIWCESFNAYIGSGALKPGGPG
jgi:hypothetical protein